MQNLKTHYVEYQFWQVASIEVQCIYRSLKLLQEPTRHWQMTHTTEPICQNVEASFNITRRS